MGGGGASAGDTVSERGYSSIVSIFFNVYLVRQVRDSFSDPIVCVCLWERIRGSRNAKLLAPRKMPQFYNVTSDKGVLVSSVIIM